jgi:hypothetical protein
MAESYVEYVEEHAAHVPSITVSRLASALDSSVDALSGGVVEVPPGELSGSGRGHHLPHR